MIEDDDEEGFLGLKDLGESEKRSIFTRYHNSMKEDESGNCFIIVIVDNFSKLVGLYPAQNTTSKEFVRALLQWG